MSLFGWSYPPGCSGPPDDDRAISPLSESVLSLLEDAEMPTPICDKIMLLIGDWESEKVAEFAAAEAEFAASERERKP